MSDAMPHPEDPKLQIECPTDCPNRKRDGVTLDFGAGKKIHLDPFEMLLYLLLMLPIGITIRDSFAKEFTFQEAAWRVGAIAGLAWGIRKAPTQDIYTWMSTKSLDR